MIFSDRYDLKDPDTGRFWQDFDTIRHVLLVFYEVLRPIGGKRAFGSRAWAPRT